MPTLVCSNGRRAKLKTTNKFAIALARTRLIRGTHPGAILRGLLDDGSFEILRPVYDGIGGSYIPTGEFVEFEVRV